MRNISDIIGVVGVFLTLIAYFLLHINKIRPDKFAYPVLNSVGSALILYSIFFAWNISAFIMEICWLFISLLGVWKCYRKHCHV